jgi:hypothetical protein
MLRGLFFPLLGSLTLLATVPRSASAQVMRTPGFIPLRPAVATPALTNSAMITATSVATPVTTSSRTGSPITIPSLANQSINPIFQIAPGLTLPQAAYNTAISGQAIRQVPPYALGYNPYPQAMTLGSGYSMAGAYGSGGYGGGYGSASLTSTPYGNGYSTGGSYGDTGSQGASSPYSGSSDPYSGYLRASAAETNAEGRYLSQVQQARSLQSKADTSKLDLHRRIAEEAALERKTWLNPEDERVREMRVAYVRATREPPVTEILSGQALNDLYNHVYPLQAKRKLQGVEGPDVPLDPDVVQQLNFTGSGSLASLALAKDRGRLRWPVVLQAAAFDPAREELSALTIGAWEHARLNRPIGSESLRGMLADVRSLNETLLRQVGELSPSDYIVGKRYLGALETMVRSLQDPNVSNLPGQWREPRARSVEELVETMGAKGLRFAPATAGDEPAYRHVYERLLAYDARLTDLTTKQ